MAQADGILGFIANRMTWLTQRQKVLAMNVANADTPNYKPQDLTQPSFGDELRMAMGMSASQRVTQVNHIRTGSDFGNGVQVVKAKSDAGSVSGNSVDLEGEMMKVSETMMDYQAMTSLLKKWQGLIRTAIGRA